MHLFLPVAMGSTRPRHRRAWDKETMATDKVALCQSCPLGILPADDRALEESQDRVCFFCFFFLIPCSILIN